MDTLLTIVGLLAAAGFAYFIIIARKKDSPVPPPATAPQPVQIPVYTAPVPVPPKPSEPVPGTNLPPNPTITDLLFRPSTEIGAVLDGRVAATPPSAEIPVSPWPAVITPAIGTRLRVNVKANVLYLATTSGIARLQITPTASDMAGQAAKYRIAALAGMHQEFTPSADWYTSPAMAGAYITDLPRDGATVAFFSDRDSQVWVDITPYYA